MDDDVLLTIGAFARAVELSPSALRYYDDCGLLAPAEVDGSTGYRYYSPELASRARLVRWMRDVGVPVETMRVVLDGTSQTPAQRWESSSASGPSMPPAPRRS